MGGASKKIKKIFIKVGNSLQNAFNQLTGKKSKQIEDKVDDFLHKKDIINKANNKEETYKALKKSYYMALIAYQFTFFYKFWTSFIKALHLSKFWTNFISIKN